MLFNPPWRIVAAGYSAETWGIFCVVAVSSVLIPHSLYYGGLRYLTASRAIITATFEPIAAICSAFIFLNEVLAPVQIFGAMLVMTAIILLQIKQEAPLEVHE